VAGWEGWVQPAGPSGPQEPVVHIAEKFRQAYISRQERVKAKMERNWQQQRRREARQRSQSESLIRQWESEV